MCGEILWFMNIVILVVSMENRENMVAAQIRNIENIRFLGVFDHIQGIGHQHYS